MIAGQRAITRPTGMLFYLDGNPTLADRKPSIPAKPRCREQLSQYTLQPATGRKVLSASWTKRHLLASHDLGPASMLDDRDNLSSEGIFHVTHKNRLR
jgi:hypothetical protein